MQWQGYQTPSNDSHIKRKVISGLRALRQRCKWKIKLKDKRIQHSINHKMKIKQEKDITRSFSIAQGQSETWYSQVAFLCTSVNQQYGWRKVSCTHLLCVILLHSNCSPNMQCHHTREAQLTVLDNLSPACWSCWAMAFSAVYGQSQPIREAWEILPISLNVV